MACAAVSFLGCPSSSICQWGSRQPCDCLSECLSRSAFPTNTAKSLPQFTTHWHFAGILARKILSTVLTYAEFVLTLQNYPPLHRILWIQRENTEGER